MARFFSFALLFLALVSVGLANVRPKPVKKEYQLAITGDGCGVKNMNLICSTGTVAAGNMVKSPLLKSQMAQFLSFALFFLALVFAARANVHPKLAKKEYQLLITGDGCGVQNMNLICSSGNFSKILFRPLVKRPLFKSEVSSGGKNSVYIQLAEIRKIFATGASRN
ncbi:hypothetical protein TYRP_014720 [Tyrophagus putrescentiae]|nr:hypothetical protein TYRP_014720 [Tyrophagus putrescentiae]